jgi:hypothetical protein
MRIKFFQIVLVTSVSCVCLAHLATAKDNSPFHLGRDHVAPVVALEEAVALAGPTGKSLVSESEMEIFKKVAAGDAKSVRETDAILFAANIHDPKELKRYAAMFDQITVGARKAIAGAKTPSEKADKLNAFLFKNPLHGGFENNQVDFKKLLDQGKFNCVSSCILYNLVGHRLGLKTRAVTGPNHVFLRMGDWYIEPVSGESCDAHTHEQVVDRLWAQATDNWKVIFGNTRTYQSGNLGLVGEIYLDYAGNSQAAKHNEEAAINVLKAACLDPTHPVFAYQTEQLIRSWFNDTLNQKNYTKAKKIAAIYGQLYGDDSSKLFQQVAAARSGRLIAKG